jgi:hypothetical protein
MSERKKYRRESLTRDFINDLVEEHGNLKQAAIAIADDCIDRNGKTPTYRTVQDWFTWAMYGGLKSQASQISQNAIEAAALNRLAELITEANIPIEHIGRIEKVRLTSHGTPMKLVTRDAAGKVISEKPHVEVAHATSLVFSPSWDDGPKWPVVQPCKPVRLEYAAPHVWISNGLRTEVVIPDTQFGYSRNLDTRAFDGKTETYALETMHDETACDLALQIVAAVQPDGLTHVGDLLDLSEFSRYLQVEEFYRTTQASLDRAQEFLTNLRQAQGRGTKTKPKVQRLVAGNHDPDRRIGEYITKNARAAYGLRPANATPESWPMFSTAQLLRLDMIGWEYMGNWPGSEAWLIHGDHGLVVVHDPQRKGFYQASVIAGHTHHHRQETFTTRTPGGTREFTLYEIGCLCSRDRVKSKTSIQRTRVPSDRGNISGWAQGVAVVEILDDGRHRVDFVKFSDDIAIYRGQVFKAGHDAAA